MLRLDVESRETPSRSELEWLEQRAVELIRKVHAVILSDYAKGALSDGVCRAVIRAARSAGIPVLVDPKTRDFGKYAGATIDCPNLQELSIAMGRAISDMDGLLAGAQEMLVRDQFEYMTVTMSEKGIALLSKEGNYTSPARAREVFDVSGAGDTVIFTLAACIAGGLRRESAVELANIAAGIVVGKAGTVPIASHELVNAMTPSSGLSSGDKTLDSKRMTQRVTEWRASGKTVVFANGCFDLLYVGMSGISPCSKPVDALARSWCWG